MKCLVADDDPTLRKLLVRIMSARGYDCSAVGGAEELLREGVVQRPDVVVSDIDLGHGDGVAACTELAAARPELRVLLITGGAAHAKRAESAGFGPVLLKPFTFDELQAALSRRGIA